jgi:hypothetical protein
VNYSFSYRVIDSNNIPSNYATVNLKLYDPPVLHINDVQIIEGAINPIALFTVTLTGAIPIPLTISYSTQNGTQTDHSAIAGQDYQSASGTYTFSNLNPTVITQQFTISINILNDNIVELVQKFYVNLIIAGTFVNAGASDLIGEGAISDPDKLVVNNVTAGSVYESGLSPDGSAANLAEPPPISRSGNLLTGQNFGQIPLSGIDINNINHADQSGAAVYNSAAKTWTLDGSYFELVIYRENINGHLKGDYIYTLKDNVNNVNGNDFIQNLHFDLTPIDPGSQVDQNTRTDTADVIIHIADDAPTAHDDTGVFYAIKGGDSSHATGNLFANDISGSDTPLKILYMNYFDMNNEIQLITVPDEGSITVQSYYGGVMTIDANGNFSYVPPAPDNTVLPGQPNTDPFGYIVQDADGSLSAANFDVTLYDQPIIYVHPVTVTEGTDSHASVIVELIGQIPSELTVQYATQDNTATAPNDYTPAEMSYSLTFTDTNVLSQQIFVPVPITNDETPENTEVFVLSITSGPVNFESKNSQAHAEAIVTILDDDFYSLKATDDHNFTTETYIPAEVVNPPFVGSGNLLTNDITTAPSNTLAVSSIQFTVDNLSVNYPDLYQQYQDQSATITPPESGSTIYNIKFDLPTDSSVVPINMPDGSKLEVQSNGHYDFYQPLGGISQDTNYAWNYTITAPFAQPSNPGDDQATLHLTLRDQNIAVTAGTANSDFFTVHLDSSPSNPNIVVIQHFGAGGVGDTLNFSNVLDNNHDNVIDFADVIANINSVQTDNTYPGINVNFTLTNGTTVIMQNIGSIGDPPPPSPLSPAALLTLIDDHGNITINTSPP